LGLDIGKCLEVTNCFPLPDFTDETEEESDQDARAEYQIEMMRRLREVNVDNNIVGWYQSAFLGSFFSDQMIKTQVNYQINLRKCVAIVYDPLQTSHGALSLKAFRLTDTFVELYRQSAITQGDLSKMNRHWTEIFEEINIVIRNSNLINACLYELQDSRLLELNSPQFDILDLSTNTFLEKNLEALIDSIDELVLEQQKHQYYQRTIQRQQAQINSYRQKKKS